MMLAIASHAAAGVSHALPSSSAMLRPFPKFALPVIIRDWTFPQGAHELGPAAIPQILGREAAPGLRSPGPGGRAAARTDLRARLRHRRSCARHRRALARA